MESIRLKVEAGEMIINTRMVPASNLLEDRVVHCRKRGEGLVDCLDRPISLPDLSEVLVMKRFIKNCQ